MIASLLKYRMPRKLLRTQIKPKQRLHQDSVDCKLSTRHAKVNMVVAAAKSNLSFLEKKKLLIKAEARVRAKNSMMSAYSYATAALMIQFFEGN